LEHSALPSSAQECLSELVVVYLRERGDQDFTFSVEHYREWEKIELPTPIAIFLKETPWVTDVRRDDITFATPGSSWSTTAARQLPPRFVARFATEPGSRASLPPILFDARVGLQDWANPKTAVERLASLADALIDLSAAERRDLRTQLRRCWTDIADAKLSLPASLVLVVERLAGPELLRPDDTAKPVVYVTSEPQGFSARALADRGEAVLDVGENDAATIRDLLEQSGSFSPRLADTGDVQLFVDGARFEPTEGTRFSRQVGWSGLPMHSFWPMSTSAIHSSCGRCRLTSSSVGCEISGYVVAAASLCALRAKKCSRAPVSQSIQCRVRGHRRYSWPVRTTSGSTFS
jgi:hypothetical protein